MIRVVLVVLALTMARPAGAADVYTFFDAKCQRYSGVLANVENSAVYFVDLRGQLVQLERDRIHSIVIHQLLESPIHELNIDAALRTVLRDVWIGDDEAPSFSGWATAFFDDLTIFVDVHGKTHVVDPADISRLDTSDAENMRIRAKSSSKAPLGFPPEIVPCSKRDAVAGSMPPSRVIADRIKVGDYLAKLEESYRRLREFQERTKVYAKPFVFEEDSRFGLIYHQDSDPQIPIYFRWSSGRPYRFQSETTVGNVIHRWLPITVPTLSVASDAKSHFFNASFIGNIVALPAGSDAFLLTRLSELQDDGESPDKLQVVPGYNYIILMGADYWRFSVSGGPAYLTSALALPDVGLWVIPADKASAAARVRYQAPNFSLRALYFHTRLNGDLEDVVEDDVVTGTYRYRSDSIRLGGSLRVWELDLSLDHVVTFGRFSATVDSQSQALDYSYFDTIGSISSNFGRYVTVRAFGRFVVRRHEFVGDLGFPDDDGTQLRFGGALEFVF